MIRALIIILAACALSATGAKCPQPEFVYPCTCRPWETGLFVVCRQVNNTNRLKIIFQLLREYEITRMLLKDCHLEDSSIFDGMNIKLLRLIDTTITRADNSRRPGPIAILARYLDRLDMTNCDGVLRVQEFALGPLAKMKDLNVILDNIGVLKRAHLPNPSNITNLRLEQCGISDIESGSMSHLTSLKSLALLRNELTTFRRDVLPTDVSSLISIDLSENKLASLPDDFFEGMTNLHTVNLYENQLQCLSQNIWSPVWSRLDKLWINGNRLTCDSTVEWIFDQERQPTMLYGACSLPPRLHGTQISQLTRSELVEGQRK